MSCGAVLSAVLVSVALTLGAVSLGTSSWQQQRDTHWGLWQHCDTFNCTTLTPKSIPPLPNWLRITRLVYASQVLLSILVLLSMCCAACCRQVEHGTMQLAVVLHVLAVLAVALSLLMIGVKGEDAFQEKKKSSFGWSYWVAVATGANLLLSIVAHVCMIPNTPSRKSGYQRIEPTAPDTV